MWTGVTGIQPPTGEKEGLEAGQGSRRQKGRIAPVPQAEPREQYLLVDGYNVIHAWPELQELAQENMDLARIRLLDALSSYQALKKNRIIVVFDAYQVEHRTVAEVVDYHNIHVVFTKGPRPRMNTSRSSPTNTRVNTTLWWPPAMPCSR